MKSNGDAIRMTRSLMLGFVKHCEVYVIDGVREGNGIEITFNDVDYVLKEGEDSGSRLIKVKVDAKSEPSTKEEAFDNSADDDHFGFEMKDNNLQSNAFEGFNGPMNEEVPIASVAQGDESLREVDEQIGNISDGYEITDIDSYEGDSDDMIKKKRFSKYNEVEMHREEYEFHVVLKFESLNQFKYAIKDHALFNGRDIVGSYCFRIKTLKKKHTCGRNYNDSLASSSWI
ncbi:hypothetical protein Ahy_A09g042940 [Arachis hypogaea]|uniref:Transposase MuDR plant domain-containing protein n=1 Tax=Arachis hypogaea TaxID=3818 RepID=A0A445BH54_ARAHY|nr:hypothetical protein Ahy_A09g042940 [Arachis hypogaea]